MVRLLRLNFYTGRPNSSKSSNSKIPESAASWNGHYYLRVDELMTKNVAQEYAESLGGHLARVETKAEHKFLSELVKSGKIFLPIRAIKGDAALRPLLFVYRF